MPQPTLTAALQNCRRDWDGAIADFDRALQFDPKLAQAYDNRGDAKTETGDFDGAIADFNRALQLNPKYAKAYDNRGLAKLSRGDLDGAIADSTARCSSTRNSPRHMLAMAVRIFWLTTGRQRCRATGVFANCRNEIRHIPACSSGLFVRA